ncbi:MAG: hypothetical protein ABSG84_19185 [Acidobacteriaceae bacterium]|jgi:hypothetical protein
MEPIARKSNLIRPSILPLFLTLFLSFTASATQPHLASAAAYHRYIDPLLAVKDFKTHYYEDGAADATVLFPLGDADHPYPRPVDPVIALVRLREKSIPLIIDCLSDSRITSVRFDGNAMTRPMNVPLGYVCLDILMGTTKDRSVYFPDCADDGLGACIEPDFYFRPDDYTCWNNECLLRPWISVVQRNWRAQYLAHRLRFHNPYDILNVDEYKDLRTPGK